MNHREHLNDRFRTRPEQFWHAVDTTVDCIDAATQHGWSVLTTWGDLGLPVISTERAMLFTSSGERWQLAHYLGGQVATWSFSDQADRDTVIDGIAFWHWKTAGEPWVKHYTHVDQLPPYLRGPYGPERATTPRLTRALVIPTDKAAEVWYVRPTLDVLTGILDGPLEAVEITANAHLYCHEEGKIKRQEANLTATKLWNGARQSDGHDILAGTVIVLGTEGSEEADCPQWIIDTVELLQDTSLL
jgi:uncharacterized protein DUF3846